MNGAEPIDTAVETRISQRRQHSDISINALSIAAHVSPADHERIQAGLKQPEPEELLRTAAALKTTIADLMDVETDLKSWQGSVANYQLTTYCPEIRRPPRIGSVSEVPLTAWKAHVDSHSTHEMATS